MANIHGKTSDGLWTPVIVDDDGAIAQGAKTADTNPTATNYNAFTGADQSYALPESGGTYMLQTHGNACVVRMDAAAAIAVPSRGMYIPEGGSVTVRLVGTNLHMCAPSAAGGLWVVQLV